MGGLGFHIPHKKIVLSSRTSMSAPAFPPAFTAKATNPWLAVRPADFMAAALPFFLSQSTALDTSLSLARSAFLHSIMGAPVLSRNCFTRLAGTVVAKVRTAYSARDGRRAGRARNIVFFFLIKGGLHLLPSSSAKGGKRLDAPGALGQGDQGSPLTYIAYVLINMLKTRIA
jgi:hypothetical protein